MGQNVNVTCAASTTEAADLIAGGAVPLAGATWIMRTELREERYEQHYVALTKIDLLRALGGDPLRIGALVTHTELAAALGASAPLAALRAAAANSANPNVRNVATIGGAIGARTFPASDIVTALLALDAELELIGAGGSVRSLALADYLASSDRDRELITAIIIRSLPQVSGHARLTQRSAGDYPAAIVTIAVGTGGDVAVAVGSVEARPQRWPALERALSATSGLPDPEIAAEAARAHSDQWNPRASVELPPWYRVAVLPEIVRRAVIALQED